MRRVFFLNTNKIKRMNLADVNIPSKFTEESQTFEGNKTLSARSVTGMSKQRLRAENTIKKIAATQNIPVDEVIKKILIQSTPVLRRYITSKGETPNTNPLLLMVQATLLRADEVGTIAKAIDTTDEDSLLQIESAEQDAIDTNNPDVKNILPPDVQAALKLTLDHIKSAHIYNKGSGKLKDFIQQLKNKSKSDGFDLNTATLLGSPTGGPIGSKSPGGVNLPNGFDIGPIDPNTNYLQNNENPVPATGGLFDIFDKIVKGITSVTGGIKDAAGAVKDAIGSTKGSITDLLGGVSNQASDIGAVSIQKAMKEYIPYIVAGVVAIVLVIVIAIYASKHK